MIPASYWSMWVRLYKVPVFLQGHLKDFISLLDSPEAIQSFNGLPQDSIQPKGWGEDGLMPYSGGPKASKLLLHPLSLISFHLLPPSRPDQVLIFDSFPLFFKKKLP